MFRRSRRSSIALTLLFFFVFSIACCLPVGVAENPPPAGGGGGGELPLLTINPTSVTVPFEGTKIITIYDSQTGLWTGSEPLALHLYNADTYGCPVGDSIGGWFSANGGFLVTDSDLTVELECLPLLQPGSFVFEVVPDNGEGSPTPLGQALFTVEGDTATTPVTLTATPDHGLPGTTISITLAEPIDDDLWSIQDPVMPRLVTPANPTAGSMPVQDAYFDNVIVSDDSISTDLNLAETVAPGQYVIEVLLGEAVIGTAFFEVDDNELPVGTATAWLSTSSYETGQTGSTGSVRASVANGYLKLGVNVENVSFTYGTFELDYDPNIFNNPTLSYNRAGLTPCDVEIWPLENGMNTVHVEFYGATSIGPASNDPYSSDWPTLFELNFTANQEGTLPLSLWHMRLPGAQPETCILDLFNDAGIIDYGPKAYNDEPVLFTFTDKDNVVYVYDMNTGEPLIGTLNAVMNDDTRVPQNVTADPYGGYFYDNVTGAKDFELLVPGYDPTFTGTGQYAYHSMLGRSPSMLGFSPHMSRPSANDMHYTCYLPGIGSNFDTSSYTYELYYRDSNDDLQLLTKNINFSAGDDEDQIKVTFVGGLQILYDEDYQLYDLYIYKNDEFLGRGYFVLDENFCPYLCTDPETVTSDYTGNITIKGFEGMQGPEPVPWVANDNLNLQLWLYNSQTQQSENTGLVPTVGTVSDTDLTFTLPPNVTENRYIIYVLRGSDKIAEAHISVENGQSTQPAVITLTPNQVNTGDSLSFTFDLSNITMQNSPWAVVVIPSGDPDTPPTLVTSAVALTQLGTGDYQAVFSETIDDVGSFLLVIFDGQPISTTDYPPIAAIGSFQVVEPTGYTIISINPNQVNTGDSLSFTFDLSNVTMQNSPWAVVVIPSGDPDTPPTLVTSAVALTQLGTGDYQAVFSQTIDDPGSYVLAVFDGEPISPTDHPPVVAIGMLEVVEPPAGPATITLTPAQVNTGDSLSFTFDLSGVTLQNSPYAVIVQPPTGPGVQPAPVTSVVAVTQLETDGYQVAFDETINVAGKYFLVVFDGQPTDPVNLPPVAALGELRILPPLFTLTPNKILAGDSLKFEFSLPEGVSVNNPYAVLGNLDTEFSGPVVRVSSSEGICQVYFYPWMLQGQPSGEYYVGIMEGMPQQDTRCLAAGKFDYVQLPWVNANPDPVLMPYPSGQNISLEEPWEMPLLWNENDELTLQFFKEECQQDIMTLTSVPFSGSVQVLGNIINFTLPDEWAEGWYQVRVYRGEERIAISSFAVNYPWFDVNPWEVPAYFRQSPVIELCENQYEIWSATDTLEVHLFYNDKDPERVLEATISGNALDKTDDLIRFNLPTAVNCGYHQVELFRGGNLIARGGFYIDAPQYQVQPHPLFTGATDRTVSLHKNDPQTWYANEAGQLKLEIHQKSYYGPEPWQYNLEYKQTIESANLTVNEDTISFVFPESLNKGRYELILQRKINADFWRTVGKGDLLCTDMFINLPISSDVFIGDPPAVREGYELPINFTLTDTGGNAWSAGESLNLNLFHFHPIEKRWNMLPQNMQPYDVVVEEDTIKGILPTGIWAGDYTISVSRANTLPPDEFAVAQFRVLPLLELEGVNLPPAQVNEPYFGTVKVKGGTAPYYWSINSLPPEFQWPVGNMEWYPNQNDSSQLIITGTFTEPGVYPLEIRVEDNDGRVSYHPIQLVVREGMPRVIAGNAVGLPGREVIVPIMGENLMGTGVSGIQFTLDYDPAVATIADTGILPGMIPEATIESNIDNVNGHAYITVAWTQPLPEQVSFAEFCRIKFQINNNPANANCTVYLNDVDGTILSDGEYDIPAEAINGSIRAAGYGDVNGNGKVDVGDAVLILRYSAGIINLPEPLIELADVDDIDGVGPTDAILVLKRVVRLIDHFPIELPVVL